MNLDGHLTRVLMEETVRRSVQQVRVPELRPGTVTSATGPMVLIDGDTVSTQVPSLVGAVYANQRVMVVFYPPAGVAIIGIIDAPMATWSSPFSSGVTTTNGTLGAYYSQSGAQVTAHLNFTMASGSAVTGSVVLALPVAAVLTSSVVGVGEVIEAGGPGYPIYAITITTTTAGLYCYATASTFGTRSAVNATTPFTFNGADLDRIHVTLNYLAA